MILKVGDEVTLHRSQSAWAGARVKITSIDDRRDEFGLFTVYNFEVLDKSLPEHDGDSTGHAMYPYMGSTPFKSDFIGV